MTATDPDGQKLRSIRRANRSRWSFTGAFARFWLGMIGLIITLTGQAGASPCQPAPEPVLSLGFDSRYADGDATRSEIDLVAEAQARSSLEPVDVFIRDLADVTDTVLQERDPDARRALAQCGLSRLAHWARADALANLSTQTAELTIGSRLAAFGLIATRLVDSGGNAEDGRVVAEWLQRRMVAQMTFWERAPDGARIGNLRLWAALAAAATAQLSDDAVLRGWAAWSVVYVTCSTAPDGHLPREMERGSRALHYQLHALAPMVVATLLLERQGMPVLAACDGALDRAVWFALTDLETGHATEAITGFKQTLTDGTDKLANFQLSFLEAYLVLGRDPATLGLAETLAAPRRPLSYSKLGGDQTLAWMPLKSLPSN